MSLYGLIIGICLAASSWYFSRHNTVVPKSKEDFFIFGTIISALIGARAYHVIDQWPYYSQNLDQIIATWERWTRHLWRFNWWFIIYLSFFPRESCFLHHDSRYYRPHSPLAQAFGRLGNFFNQENPLWWHEALLNLFLFFLLKSRAFAHYSTSGLYFIGYGLIRFAIEFFRADTWIINNIKVAHIISLFFIIIGFAILAIKSKDRSNLT
jgi:phosphatidylglycerol---prolipoprotein diacylglyceryl transferase